MDQQYCKGVSKFIGEALQYLKKNHVTLSLELFDCYLSYYLFKIRIYQKYSKIMPLVCILLFSLS